MRILLLLFFLLAIPLVRTGTATAVTVDEVLAERQELENKFESLAGLQLDCFRRSPNESLFFLPSERFDTGDNPELDKLSEKFAGHIAKTAVSALEAGDATLAYQLLNEAHFFGATTVAERIVGAKPKEPVAKLATTNHRRLGWKRRDYFRITTDHYQIVTKDELTGVEIARRLETLYAVWRQLFFDCWSDNSRLGLALQQGKMLRPRTSRLHRVVLFANRADYNEYLRSRQPRIQITLGFYDVASRTSYFFAGPDSSPATQLHEATHQLFQEVQSVSSRLEMKQNFWAVEGIALYMESLQRRAAVATVGGFHANRLQFARYRRLQEEFVVPLDELIRLGRDQLQKDERIRRIYSQSAGLTHFFMDSTPRRRAAFISYLKSIYKGRDRIDSLAKATATAYADLDAEYRQFLVTTDEDLQDSMAPADSLTSLCLGGTRVTDRGMASLTSQANLNWLDLTRTDVGDSGLRLLENARSLRHVSLEATQITDQTLRLLGRNIDLEELDISRTSISDEGLKALSQLKSLHTLWLSDTAISDDSLETLGKLESLRYLAADRTRMTAAGRNALRKKLPNLTIE